MLGGSLRFAFLAAGLFLSLRSYRKSGFLARLAVIDWVFLAATGAFVLREASDVIFAMQHGKHPSTAEVLGWPTDPLLWLLLAESMLLYRSVCQMGPGWIGRCWKAFSLGVALIALGDIAIWATNYGYLPWPWSSLGWYIWLPAAAAFAMAPAYQLEAVWRAYAVRGRAHPSDFVTDESYGEYERTEFIFFDPCKEIKSSSSHHRKYNFQVSKISVLRNSRAPSPAPP